MGGEGVVSEAAKASDDTGDLFCETCITLHLAVIGEGVVCDER